MDSIWVSEAYDPGSIPGRATNKNHKPFTSNSLGFFVLVFSRHVDYKLLK